MEPPRCIETSQPADARARRVRRRWILGVALIAATAAGTGWALHARRTPKRLAVVEPHVLYRSAQPTVEQIENLIAEQGLRTLVIARDGDSDRVRAELKFAAEHGLNVLHVPIESRQRVPDDVVRRFFDCVDDPAQRPMLVHCSAGRHRTGYLCALYRIERQGWTVDRAVDEMLSFGFDTEDHAAILEQLRAYRPDSTAAGRRALDRTPLATEGATP